MNTDMGGRKPYHFGNLEEALIEQEAALIYGEGIEEFSLRETAKKVGVSTAACYNHFRNMDDLLREMYPCVIDRFTTTLKQAVEDNPCHHVTISIGVTYMEFFTEYLRYFNFLFGGGYLGIRIKGTETTWNSSFTPFRIFVTSARGEMRELNINERESGDNPLVMWVAVYGLAVMADIKGAQYNSGSWGALTERLLPSKVVL